jgi:AraC-like DNA-binding protein
MKPNYKPVLQGESKLFNVILQNNEKEFEYSWHYHKECELVYILNGYGHRYVGNNIDVFASNDLVLLGSNLPHCWINEVEHSTESPSAIVVYLKEDLFSQTWFESQEFGSIRKLLELAGKGIKFSPKIALRLKKKCMELSALQPLKRFILLMEILQDLSEISEINYQILSEQDLSCNLNPVNNERINIIYKYIENNYQKKITLAEIAKAVCMSPGYFSRFFSKTMKKSFFEFLNEYKVNHSCKLLIETDKPISGICYDSGFESIPFFYRQFKKFKGCQPKQYRLNYSKASS